MGSDTPPLKEAVLLPPLVRHRITELPRPCSAITALLASPRRTWGSVIGRPAATARSTRGHHRWQTLHPATSRDNADFLGRAQLQWLATTRLEDVHKRDPMIRRSELSGHSFGFMSPQAASGSVLASPLLSENVQVGTGACPA